MLRSSWQWSHKPHKACWISSPVCPSCQSSVLDEVHVWILSVHLCFLSRALFVHSLSTLMQVSCVTFLFCFCGATKCHVWNDAEKPADADTRLAKWETTQQRLHNGVLHLSWIQYCVFAHSPFSVYTCVWCLNTKLQWVKFFFNPKNLISWEFHTL